MVRVVEIARDSLQLTIPPPSSDTDVKTNSKFLLILKIFNINIKILKSIKKVGVLSYEK